MFLKRLILVMVTVSLFSSCHVSSPSRGQKIGHIVKIAHEGVLFSTWEGELIRGGLNDGSGSFGKSFHFVIEDRHLVDVAIKALNSNKEVVLYYHCELFSFCTRSEHSEPHFVDRIEFRD